MKDPGRRVIFTIGELAQFAGESKHIMLSTLRSAGVPIYTRGGRRTRFVYWPSVERANQDLADALRFRVRFK